MVSAWLPVVAYLALIMLLSSISTLAPPGDVTNMDKVAHSVEYGLLGWVLLRAWGRTLPVRTWLPRILTLVSGVIIAAADERLQAGVGRSATWGDWVTDSLAILGVVLIGWAVVRRRVPADGTMRTV